MDLKTQLNEAMKDAMRSGDTVRKNTTRLALAAIKQIEVDKQTKLDDPAVIALLQKEIKNRKEEYRPARGLLDQTFFITIGAGKSPRLIPEQLAFYER